MVCLKMAIVVWTFLWAVGCPLGIDITEPWQSTVWQAGKNATIRLRVWGAKSAADGPLTLELLRGDPDEPSIVATINEDVPSNTTVLVWLVPDTLLARTDYYLRMTTGQLYNNFYSAFFRIKGSDTVRATATRANTPASTNDHKESESTQSKTPATVTRTITAETPPAVYGSASIHSLLSAISLVGIAFFGTILVELLGLV
ncbi:hypothetical protein H4R33_003967 [Dimargaris cristalligena]|uniref:Yeast cell wall synthesis Kre9/Knh1-like N-terminal domain-containing protein n=1 Tax=Dimargaris cristalligena TaxID=215637 RepID=A0A4P9ZXP5_9FUNG|nr:hypothetical protein H4R33_003967 [Dimargaris cristalligena]RKP37510.1 hypothetical protein BJ085DRAFT_41620 [Dimargaris cristalligena]|eukprot:RKP37510.1 hypothetical protein BJ085DRAFT_41620 [Dimargaris cristalligena]